MRSAQAEVNVYGVPVIRRRLTRFQQRVTDASPAFRRIAGILRRATAENFKTRGSSGGSRWRDLPPARRAYKARHGLDPRILRATGRLYGSFIGAAPGVRAARDDRSGRFIGGAGDHVEEVTATSLNWGSRVPYGVYHQSLAPRRVIPYRPPVRLTERTKREIAREMQRSLVEG